MKIYKIFAQHTHTNHKPERRCVARGASLMSSPALDLALAGVRAFTGDGAATLFADKRKQVLLGDLIVIRFSGSYISICH